MKIWKKIISALMCTAAVSAAVMNVSAEKQLLGYLGDVNFDSTISVADAVLLQKSLVTGFDGLSTDPNMQNADINEDGVVNVNDVIILRRCILGECEWKGIYTETDDPTDAPTEAPTETPTEEPTEPATTTTTTTTTMATTTVTTTTVTTTVTTTPPVTTTTIPVTTTAGYITDTIKEIGASLPSQGDANLVIFYVDFPDCTYGSADITAEQIDEIAFGAADETNANYPFESMSAFYGRSSKGAMNLKGKAFRYTTKENQSAYDTDKVKIAKECYEYFKDTVDFAQFDGNNDGYIDATLFTTPTAAGDANWWPCAGAFGDGDYVVDGKKIGHIITGNAQIESLTDYSNFNSSYLHEMGHCMGLPDYYLYSSEDFEGMHGSAGTELMDADAFSDFGAFSKLMLGWYRQNQVTVYDKSAGTQTFELSNAQTGDGNCVIIPKNQFGSNYANNEYFVIEYSSTEGNNSGIARQWWSTIESGIRIYHVKTDIHNNGWWSYFKYGNGSEFTDTNGDGTVDDEGIRVIRLVNDGNGPFTTEDVINNSISGFGWYDQSENETVDPGVSITVGELKNDKYTITIG